MAGANPFVSNQLFPDQSNPFAAAAPTPADAYTSNANAYQGWLAQQRASGVASGMLDPQTGWPTGNALIDAARQYGGAMLAGTSAPGGMGKAVTVTGKIPVLANHADHYAENPSHLVDDLTKILGEDGDFALGLRGPYAGEMGKVSLNKSWQSPDGVNSYRLPGTSTVGVSSNWEMDGGYALENQIKSAMSSVKRYGDQGYITVVKGDFDSKKAHLANDPSESILNNAKAVAYIPVNRAPDTTP
jgi:hypothetical protein